MIACLGAGSAVAVAVLAVLTADTMRRDRP